jgi:hypothetical protein
LLRFKLEAQDVHANALQLSLYGSKAFQPIPGNFGSSKYWRKGLRPDDTVHGHIERHAVQPRHPPVLSAVSVHGKAQEGGDYSLHAQIHRHFERDAEGQHGLAKLIADVLD